MILSNFGRMVKQCPVASPTTVQSPLDDISLSSPNKIHLSCFGQTQSFFPKVHLQTLWIKQFFWDLFIHLFLYFGSPHWWIYWFPCSIAAQFASPLLTIIRGNLTTTYEAPIKWHASQTFSLNLTTYCPILQVRIYSQRPSISCLRPQNCALSLLTGLAVFPSRPDRLWHSSLSKDVNFHILSFYSRITQFRERNVN